MATNTMNENLDQPQRILQPERRPERLSFQFLSRQRVWSRFAVVAAVMFYIWYSSKNGKETTLAKHKDVLQQRGQAFPCDTNYLKEITGFNGCVPKKCGRYVSDKLVTLNEANTLLKIAKGGFALGGSDGGVSILDLHSGALSLGMKFIDVYSLHESVQVFNAIDLGAYKTVKAKIQKAIAETFHISIDELYLTHPTFFSRLTNLEPKSGHDHYWHIHVDMDVYKTFHYTSLVYLSDYGSEFEGGRLIWLDSPKNNVTVEPRKGRVAFFSSGGENIHFVERVTSGTRYAITVSFTCDVSKSINDPVLPEEC